MFFRTKLTAAWIRWDFRKNFLIWRRHKWFKKRKYIFIFWLDWRYKLLHTVEKLVILSSSRGKLWRQITVRWQSIDEKYSALLPAAMRHDVNKIVNKMSQIVPDGDPLNISDEDLIKNFQECAPEPSSSSLSDVLSNQEQAVPVNHPQESA